ncbi:histidinol-phosphatase [Bacteroides propionicifaciens]|jgi:histidinol-phosphatase (PHP family)|uniref:histidinol-phosphatase n=1 Tax=Bacteroides propionicifaciens TaxID=392838 RepID=UPI00035E72F3|nr:histidinol-phosphatase [Bacteroides propionicifaciens]
MNLTNYHSHSTYCDGSAPLKKFVSEALNQGFTSYGFSSHAPLPFSTNWNMDKDKMEDYLEECCELVVEYKNKIELYLGLEIDYLTDEYNPSSAYFQNLPLDYRIGSVHFVEIDNEQFVDVDCGVELFRENVQKYFNRDYEEVVIRYFEAQRKLILAGGFDFIGHCDKISKNASANAKGILDSSFYKSVVKSYFEFVAQHKCMLEINSKAYELRGMLFPNIEHFELLRELEIPVMVNSDSHKPQLINSGRKEALKALHTAKFDRVMELHDGVWTGVPIHTIYRY